MVSGKLPGDARARFALMSVKRWSQENAFYRKEVVQTKSRGIPRRKVRWILASDRKRILKCRLVRRFRSASAQSWVNRIRLRMRIACKVAEACGTYLFISHH